MEADAPEEHRSTERRTVRPRVPPWFRAPADCGRGRAGDARARHLHGSGGPRIRPVDHDDPGRFSDSARVESGAWGGGTTATSRRRGQGRGWCWWWSPGGRDWWSHVEGGRPRGQRFRSAGDLYLESAFLRAVDLLRCSASVLGGCGNFPRRHAELHAFPSILGGRGVLGAVVWRTETMPVVRGQHRATILDHVVPEGWDCRGDSGAAGGVAGSTTAAAAYTA